MNKEMLLQWGGLISESRDLKTRDGDSIELQEDTKEVNKKIREIESYVRSIDNSNIRRLVRYKCIDGYTWRQVSRKMGKGWGEDKCRKTFNDLFKKTGQIAR